MWLAVLVRGCRSEGPGLSGSGSFASPEGGKRSGGRELWGWLVLVFLHFTNTVCSWSEIFCFPPFGFIDEAENVPRMLRRNQPPRHHRKFGALVMQLAAHLLFVLCENCSQKRSLLLTGLKGGPSLSHQWRGKRKKHARLLKAYLF